MKLYAALGDSISIDEYPERETGVSGIGAASLFARALQERFPAIEFLNLTADGATTEDVLRFQLPHLPRRDDPAIVTITAGGNDLLLQLRAARPPTRLVGEMIERVIRIVDQVSVTLPSATILLGTVYDPSDGTNVLYGERLDREAGWLARFNDAVRSLATSRPNLLLADIHARFLGHGLTAPERERWYWSGLIFEPNARGAGEVCALWREVLRESLER